MELAKSTERPLAPRPEWSSMVHGWAQAVDWLLAASCAVLTVRVGLGESTGHRPYDSAGIALTVLSQLPVAARRHAPVAVFAVSCALAALSQVAGYGPDLNRLAPQLAFLTVAGTRPTPLTGGCAMALSGYLTASGLASWPNPHVDTVIQTVAWVGMLWVTGAGYRKLQLRNRQLAELAVELARLNADNARQALTVERVRIARELHDLVSHHLSVITVQAELGGYVIDADTGTARRALAAIADAGRDAVTDLHHLLDALRLDPDQDPGRGRTPAPGLGRLSELTGRVQAAGVPLHVTVTGHRRPLGTGLEVCAYRIVQESLTNIVKHARPTRAELTLEYLPHALRVTVENDGDLEPRPASGVRYGLIGMAERARIYGGTLTAERTADGGFRVRLDLPTPDTTGTAHR
ncbi:sensor histidine kinase [Catenulispora yoronensis]|uniref:histidine kinase n=1 Tax=Catenulispora yoronensis TaxID=450799 RepID=A0ABN2UJY5_9ACTN